MMSVGKKREGGALRNSADYTYYILIALRSKYKHQKVGMLKVKSKFTSGNGHIAN